MWKIILSLALMWLAVACGNGFEKNESKKKSEQNAQEVNSRTMVEEYTDLVNNHRAKLGLRSLSYNLTIEEIAKSHSKGMAMHSRPFGHMGFSLRCRQIKKRVGRHSACGEIVAMGQKTAKKVFEAWMNSPTHRMEIENPRFTMTGLGTYKDSNGVIYWTQMFVDL